MSLLGAVEEQIHEYKKKYNWGKDGAIKSDEFLGKFQTAFDPPPSHFRKIMFFMIDMVA